MKSKSNGQVYTPENIVRKMCFLGGLNLCGYADKQIIDNSCGDGHILSYIVDDICDLATMVQNRHRRIIPDEVRVILENNIHGIEIDPVERGKCISNLNAVVEKYYIVNEGIKWDIKCADALSVHDYDGKMDYVIGNPPYVRVHNLDSESIKDYSFAKGGMTDLYLAFFELGFRMLNETGTLVYISPSSWFTSTAGGNMRKYIMDHRNLKQILDFGHTQVFDGVTTYCAISLFKNGEKNDNVVFQKDDKESVKLGVVSYDDMCIDGKFYFDTEENLSTLRDIIKNEPEEKAFWVKNGFATLADDLFIGDFEVEGGDYWPFPKVIDVVKSSTGEVKKCIFPYLLNGKLMHEDTFRCVCPKAYEWLLSNKKKLEARATTEPWYAFGRTQAIGCVKQRKYAISSLVSPNQPVRITKVNAGAGVYGGLYVLPNFNLKDIEKIEKWLDEVLHSDEFLSYVELLGKYKSGGYYTFSSKECEKYLNWKWNKEKTKEYEHND